MGTQKWYLEENFDDYHSADAQYFFFELASVQRIAISQKINRYRHDHVS